MCSCLFGMRQERGRGRGRGRERERERERVIDINFCLTVQIWEALDIPETWLACGQCTGKPTQGARHPTAASVDLIRLPMQTLLPVTTLWVCQDRQPLRQRLSERTTIIGSRRSAGFKQITAVITTTAVSPSVETLTTTPIPAAVPYSDAKLKC